MVDVETPSNAFIVKALCTPFAFVAPFHCNFSPIDRTVNSGVAFTQIEFRLSHFCNCVPVDILSTRNVRFALSTSYSSAAAESVA